MSKTIAIRVSDEVHSALAAQCLALNQSMTELVIPAILGLIELPPAPASAIEDRLSALETQMLSVVDRLMAIAMEPPIAIVPPVDLKPTEISVEPEPIGDKRSSESDRDSDGVGTSTPEFDRYAAPILKPHSSGGYYFRFEDIEQPGLKGTIQNQAKLMGFSSQAVKIGGKATRVWLNKVYCLQTANNSQTSNP